MENSAFGSTKPLQNYLRVFKFENATFRGWQNKMVLIEVIVKWIVQTITFELWD